MTPNPILKVLSTFQRHKVKSLLIGGQASIVYGGAEFSRDSDFVILCSEENLNKLKIALKALKAKTVFLPPLKMEYLERGHACHFRCKAKGLEGLRIDILTKMRGCDTFDALWIRRKTVKVGGQTIEMISMRDLVQSKKTQRDKDWLMLKRLVENDIILHRKNPSKDRVLWWFLECRNPLILISLTKEYNSIAKALVEKRPLLAAAITSNKRKLEALLQGEEKKEREKDIDYWTPLKKELEEMRHSSRRTR